MSPRPRFSANPDHGTLSWPLWLSWEIGLYNAHIGGCSSPPDLGDCTANAPLVGFGSSFISGRRTRVPKGLDNEVPVVGERSRAPAEPVMADNPTAGKDPTGAKLMSLGSKWEVLNLGCGKLDDDPPPCEAPRGYMCMSRLSLLGFGPPRDAIDTSRFPFSCGNTFVLLG